MREARLLQILVDFIFNVRLIGRNPLVAFFRANGDVKNLLFFPVKLNRFFPPSVLPKKRGRSLLADLVVRDTLLVELVVGRALLIDLALLNDQTVHSTLLVDEVAHGALLLDIIVLHALLVDLVVFLSIVTFISASTQYSSVHLNCVFHPTCSARYHIR